MKLSKLMMACAMCAVTLTGTAQTKVIAPLIFISLIENAFKHGISPTEASFIPQHINKIGQYYLRETVGHFFLQPCSCSNTASTVDCVMRHPKWRLSLQTHKLIDIR